MIRMGTVIIGCGNVAPFYCNTMPRHPILQFLGVLDQDGSRSAAFSAYYAVKKYNSLDEVLNDRNIELVINLTNPKNHFAISKACLEAGKHVYSEKPLAMLFSQAQELVMLAEKMGLAIASAPSRICAETAQTIWKALREKAIGQVHAVYAEMDGGLIFRSRYKEWVNELGMPWPYRDEFAVGCTVEHAGYPVSWMTAFFGPVETVTAFATCQIPELKNEIQSETLPPDLTVACLKFKSGLVARLTSSWIAPHDHSLRIFGDTGVLSTADVWAPKCPVYITRNKYIKIGPKTITIPWKSKFPFVTPPDGSFVSSASRMILRSPKETARAIYARFLHLKKRVDFCIGPVEVASSIREKRPCRLSPKYCLHNTEIVLAIHNSQATGSHYRVTTAFDPMEPVPWALP